MNLDLPQTIKNHSTRIYKLEHLDLEQQVSHAIDEQVAEAVSIAQKTPLRSRFRDLPIDDMKVILHQSMYEKNQHNGHETHRKLYEA